MFEFLKLSDLPKINRGILREPTSTRPIIRLVEQDGVRAVVKDFSPNKFFLRNTVGRFLIWREAKAYRKLRNLKGVPAMYGTIEGLAIVIEEIQGTDLGNYKKGWRPPDRFLDSLKELVDDFHERGIAHCDLKRAPNIILGHDGRPYIIDWGASISDREFSFYPVNLIYQKCARDDYNAITKLKLRYTPEAISPEERDKYCHRSRAERFMRAVRDRLRDFCQKIV